MRCKRMENELEGGRLKGMDLFFGGMQGLVRQSFNFCKNSEDEKKPYLI